MSAVTLRAGPVFLPHFDGPYTHPGVPRQERELKEVERKKKIDEAIAFLANITLPTVRVEEEMCCRPRCHNSICNLATYLCTRPLEIFKRAFCCCLPSCDDSVKYMPIPKYAGETLAGTTEQFERNTLGVCCIAPLVIAVTPFIRPTETVVTILQIISGLVITTTAGTNTYVFSGDIGVVPNGHGNLIVQGGIRVDAISVIKNAFVQIAEHHNEKWKTASLVEKERIYTECTQLCEKWDFIFECIVKCGLTKTAVEEILNPFSKSITTVIDEWNRITPAASTDVHYIVVADKREEKKE